MKKEKKTEEGLDLDGKPSVGRRRGGVTGKEDWKKLAGRRRRRGVKKTNKEGTLKEGGKGTRTKKRKDVKYGRGVGLVRIMAGVSRIGISKE